jgi:phosphate transport system protein
MPTSSEGFVQRTESLKGEVVAQGRRVQTMLEASFESLFNQSIERADWAVAQDDEVDSADVAIEKASVALLTEATRQGAELSEQQLRAILTIVKVNNELERVADVATEIAQAGRGNGAGHPAFPDTFRVMANSVIGILRDCNSAVHRNDPHLANIVLQSQHAVTAFKDAVLRDAEQKLAAGTIKPDFAFLLHEIANQCELIADHCTNIAEQVIYLTTGAIVRHMQTSWVQVKQDGKGK